MEFCISVSFGQLSCPPSFCVVIINISIQISEGEHRNGCEGKMLTLSYLPKIGKPKLDRRKSGEAKSWKKVMHTAY